MKFAGGENEGTSPEVTLLFGDRSLLFGDSADRSRLVQWQQKVSLRSGTFVIP